jgi:hypothetical protein
VCVCVCDLANIWDLKRYRCVINEKKNILILKDIYEL